MIEQKLDNWNNFFKLLLFTFYILKLLSDNKELEPFEEKPKFKSEVQFLI